MENKNCTRHFSSIQESNVAKAFNGKVNSNSGAGDFSKGDVIIEDASMLLECKTCTSDKESFSIKKEWIEKNNKERLQMRLQNSCIVFNFGPNSKNYYIIDERLMKILVDKLEEE